MKIFKFIKQKKTSVDEQIDNIQISIAEELSRIERLLRSSIETIGTHKRLTEAETISVLNNVQHARYLIKNLASDLKRDARL